ncbi:MAG: hypothetical protein ACP5M4_07140 [Acidobacteriaceae bacterium]
MATATGLFRWLIPLLLKLLAQPAAVIITAITALKGRNLRIMITVLMANLPTGKPSGHAALSGNETVFICHRNCRSTSVIAGSRLENPHQLQSVNMAPISEWDT